MNNKIKIPQKILAILFVIWFFASIFAMIIFNILQKPISWIIALFGQYFLVFGIIVLFGKMLNGTKRTKKAIHLFLSYFLIFIGLNLIVIPLSYYYGDKNIKENIINIILPIIIIFTTFILGFILVLSHIITLIQAKTFDKISANCINNKNYTSTNTSHNDNISHTNTLYSPIWQGYYNGELLEFESDTFTNLYKPNIGDKEYIYINPKDPEIFLDKTMLRGSLLTCIIGIFFIGFAIAGFIFYLPFFTAIF